MILRICGSNPMSSILSASSRTRYVHLFRFVVPLSRKSIRRPGVAMHISTPRSKSRACISRNMLGQNPSTIWSSSVTSPAAATHYLWSFRGSSKDTCVADMRRCSKIRCYLLDLLGQFSGWSQHQRNRAITSKQARLAVYMYDCW